MRVPTTRLQLHGGSVAGGEAEVKAGGVGDAGAKLGSEKESSATPRTDVLACCGLAFPQTPQLRAVMSGTSDHLMVL